MITTGIHIPQTVEKKLASAVADVHRETAPFTLADLRKRARAWDGLDGSHLCYFHMTFTHKGEVGGLNARLVTKPAKKFTRYGFEAEVPLFGRAATAARKVIPMLAEFLIHREVEQRKCEGLREMIHWQDDELQKATRLSSWDPSKALRTSSDCGTISEVFRARLAEHEISCREDESNHARLHAMSENKAFLERCQKTLAEERAAADHWAEGQKADGWPIFTSYYFEDRSEEDRTMIAYRDAKGW